MRHHDGKGEQMTAKAYKKIEIVGTSSTSMSAAIDAAIEKAAATMRNLAWFEVVEQRGRIEGGKVAEYQATVSIGFRLE